ncbi:uncharacterized protein KIAA0513 [Hydra vulgaris]|nr:uncharacterized protein KIAA0513-like isoform X1 [Hydra vulgaris]XP_047141477.1 uncharacterized protein KIAA0513-like isoform X1 [Hydra vulgaris]
MIPFVQALSMDGNEKKSNYKNIVDTLLNPDFDIDYNAESLLFEDLCKSFMEKFVENMFIVDGYICQEDKAKFGILVQHHEGRDWFGRYIDLQRNVSQAVDEFTFYRLVQYFAIVLFECNMADDFGPATSVMNMSFTYHFTSVMIPGRFGQPSKQYVYEYLKDQSIWKSPRFWNAAFLHAIHDDRMKRTNGLIEWNSMSNEQRKDFETGEENSTYAHLVSFLYMMKSFDVDKEERENFLHKMSVIGDLSAEKISQLEDSAEIIS